MKRMLILVMALVMVLAMVPTVAMAASGTASTPAELTSALAAAGDGDTVTVTADMALITSYTIKTGVTLKASPGVVISVSGGNTIFSMQAGSVIDGLTIQKTDKTTQQQIIMVRSSCVVKKCTITGKFVIGDSETSRAMLVESGATGILIEGNTIRALRQPAYINGGVTGDVKNNKVYGTKGWVVCLDSACTFTGNIFGGNVVDFAIIENAGALNSLAYDDIAALSAANNGAYVEYQLTNPRMYAANGVAYAAGTGTVVTAGVDPTFTIVIPSAVNLGTLQKDVAVTPQTFNVTAQNVIIEEDKEIAVSVASDYLLSSGAATLAYRLYSGANQVTDTSNVFATFVPGTATQTQAGSVQVPSTSGITTAGYYQDTMTFTIAYQ